MCRRDQSVVLPNRRMRGKSTSQVRSTTLGTGGTITGDNWPQTRADQPTIFTDGMPTPPVTSFATSKSFCRSVDATSTHNMTLAGDASFNGGIFLVATTVDRALKGSMAGERMNKSFGREVREKEMS
jgi:hypothetical protein